MDGDACVDDEKLAAGAAPTENHHARHPP